MDVALCVRIRFYDWREQPQNAENLRRQTDSRVLTTRRIASTASAMSRNHTGEENSQKSCIIGIEKEENSEMRRNETAFRETGSFGSVQELFPPAQCHSG